MTMALGRTSIYGLVDPRDGMVWYVGRADDPEFRLKRHCLYHSHSRKGEWIHELQAVGLQPQLRILEEVPREEALRHEVKWMRKLLREGAVLVNSIIGGTGKVTIKNSADPLTRFWTNVDKQGQVMPGMTTACWHWMGNKKQGRFCHGKFNYQDEIGKWHTVQAHRWLWKHERGPLDDALVLDHLCENPACVNLDHLEPKSLAANTMRGKSPHAVNARKTHYPKGHAYTPENIYPLKNGGRMCRLCNIAVTRRCQDKRRADPATRDALNAARREKRQAQRLLNPLPPKDPRTTCRRGHAWTPENEEWYQGARHCRQCRVDRAHTVQATKVRKPHHKSVVTHCPQGHPYDEANTYHGKRGDRVCRTCARERATAKRSATRVAVCHSS